MPAFACAGRSGAAASGPPASAQALPQALTRLRKPLPLWSSRWTHPCSRLRSPKETRAPIPWRTCIPCGRRLSHPTRHTVKRCPPSTAAAHKPGSRKGLPAAPGPARTELTTGRCPTALFRAPARGLTLLELMLVLGLMAILAALAWPSGTEHLRKARRLDAQHALQTLHLAQTRWRSQQGQYADTLTALGWAGSDSAQGHYRLRLEAVDANGYTLLAEGLGGQARDLDCNPMRLQVLQRATLVLGGGQDNNPRCWR